EPRRLRQHRALQGAGGEHDPHQARRSQRADPGGHPRRPPDPGHLRRRDRDRADLPGARDRLAPDRLDPRQRHAGRDGGDLHLLVPRPGLEPRRGPSLRVARPADLLSLMAARVASTVAGKLAVSAGQPRTSLWQETGRRFRRHRLAMIGSVILLLLVLAVLVGPLVWRLPINDIDFKAKLKGPSWNYPLGTDDLGQDVLARMLYGGPTPLPAGLPAMLVPASIGTAMGAPSGSLGGADDHRSRGVPAS